MLEVYNQQRSVLGFSIERSGLGVVWAAPMDFPPSKVPDTTLVALGPMSNGQDGGWELPFDSHVSMGP